MRSIFIMYIQFIGEGDADDNTLAGHADNIHKLTIARLDSGDAAFLLTATGARTFTLKV